MKRELDKPLENKLQSKLAGAQVRISEHSFGKIQAQLARRKRRRAIIWWSSAALAILLFVGAGWLYWNSNPKQEKPEIKEPSLVEITKTSQENTWNTKTTVDLSTQTESLENQSKIHFTQQENSTIKSSANSSLLEKEESDEHKINLQSKNSDITQQDNLFNKMPQDIEYESISIKNEHVIKEEKVIHKEWYVEDINHIESYLPQSPAQIKIKQDFLTGSTLPKGFFWQWSLSAGRSFFHAIPNKEDDIYFYILENKGNNFSLNATLAPQWNLSRHWSAGLQLQYHYTQAALAFQHLQKEQGSFAVIEKNGEELLYLDYASQITAMEGVFHQIGLGSNMQYNFKLFEKQPMDIGLAGSYLMLLHPNKGIPFPKNELRGTFSIGIQPMPRFKLHLRPYFSYGLSLDTSPSTIQMNRMLIGISIGMN